MRAILLTALILGGLTPAGWGLSRQAVARELKQALAQRYRIPTSAITVRPIHLSRQLLQARKMHLELNRVHLRAGIQAFPCRTGQDYALTYFTAEVRFKLAVLVTTTELHRGDTLKAGTYELREVELDGPPDEYLRNPQELKGLVAAVYLPSGKALTRNAVMTPPLVRAGREVTLTLRRKSLILKLPAVALQTGRAGQRVRIRIPQTGRLETAVVTGPARVELLTRRN